ncbi:unnamed protein product [Caretta caretta]
MRTLLRPFSVVISLVGCRFPLCSVQLVSVQKTEVCALPSAVSEERELGAARRMLKPPASEAGTLTCHLHASVPPRLGQREPTPRRSYPLHRAVGDWCQAGLTLTCDQGLETSSGS